jgi:hypothetical protein
MTKTFKWNQASGKVWTVETNTEEKYIKTIDDKGKVILEQRDLSAGAIKLMEEHFLAIVATQENKPKPKVEYNPMYA